MSVEELVHKATEFVARLELVAAQKLKSRIVDVCKNTENPKRLIIVRFPSLEAAKSCAETPDKFTVSCGITDHTPDCFDAKQAGVPPLLPTDVAVGVFIDVDGVEQPVGRVCVYGPK